MGDPHPDLSEKRLGIQSGQGRRECQPQRRARTGGRQHADMQKGRGHAPCIALGDGKERRDFASRQLAAIEDGFKHRIEFRREAITAHFLFGPEPDAIPQAVGLNESSMKST